jgi:cell fate (sporulation/competence/biofilm development) regulator YlbF (YheA/YmcA/DUF963 family)
VIDENAQELGRLIGQGDEYRALQRAREGMTDHKDLEERLKELDTLASELEQRLAAGTQPEQAEQDRYERLLGQIQGDSRYQLLVAAQSNFDKLMLRVQEQIMEGMRKGAEGRIITLG